MCAIIKKSLLLLLTLSLLVGIVSCSGGEPHTVTIVDGETTKTVTVLHGKNISSVYTPEKDGYTFDGWYLDDKFVDSYSGKVYSDITVYPSWSPEFDTVINLASTELVKSTMMVTNSCYYDGNDSSQAGYKILTGSGVIINIVGKYSYLLTNAHVATPKEHSRFTYTLHDCYGKKYSAVLVASDHKYDLAVLKFSADSKLQEAEFGERITWGKSLVSIGSPNGIFNVVTHGEFLRYGSTDDESEIDFFVGWHTAPIDQGSSGGAVFDENMKLVGINYASGLDKEGDYVCSLFIPIERVKEFLNNNNIGY